MQDLPNKRERSAAYPSDTLSAAIQFCADLREKLGKGPYSREEAAIGLGHKGVSGTSGMKIATLVHFGLLNRFGNTYTQSELAERINHPVSENDRIAAITDAAKMPKLYNDLILQFSGQALPSQLANILIRKGISSKVSQVVADDFKASMEFAGLLKNGVLFDAADAVPTPGGQQVSQGGISPTEIYTAPLPSALVPNKDAKGYTFSDVGEGWTLFVQSNDPISSKIKKLLIDAMEHIEGDKK